MQVNSNSSQLYQLMNQRSKSILDMVQDVQSGNITGAQTALTQMQAANKSLGINDSTNASDASSSSTTTASAGLSSMKNDLTAMMSAVQSGDLASAQTVWNQVQSNMATGSMPPPPPSSGDSSMGTAADDLTNLLDAVQSGDTDKMKSSATTFSKDLQGLLATSPGTDASSTSTTASTTDPSTGNPILDDLNALITAAQSGDATAAQTAQQKLQQDMQSTDQAQGAGHAHGHHHHHGGGGHMSASSSTTTTTATTTLAADGTSPDSATTASTEVDTIPA